MDSKSSRNNCGLTTRRFNRKKKQATMNQINAGTHPNLARNFTSTQNDQPASCSQNVKEKLPVAFFEVLNDQEQQTKESSGDKVNEGTRQACLSSPTTFGVTDKEHLKSLSFNGGVGVKEITKFVSKHNLTDVCLDDLLKLFNNANVTTDVSNIPRSVQGFNTAVGISNCSTRIFWTCSECKTLQERQLMLGELAPKHACCSKPLNLFDEHFIHLNPKQILELALRTAQREESFQIKDVSLVLNTDGAPLFKSSNSSFWPLLGYYEGTSYRFRKENIIMFGVWVGMKTSSKPNMHQFIAPLVKYLEECQQGFKWQMTDESWCASNITLKYVLCDSIARPVVQGYHQFNAKFGCSYCYHTEAGAYYQHDDKLNLRDMESYYSECIDLSRGRSKTGLKNLSPFFELEYFDMINGFPPDVLHVVYLGVTKMLIDCWTDSKNSKQPFYIKPFAQKDINTRLLTIRPPSRVSRTPRTLTNYRFYKGHEFMMWLLYYSPVILKEILPDTYYNHYVLLVQGVSLLTTEACDNNSIASAETCLKQFSKSMKVLYGDRYCRFNIHLLLHFPQFVRLYGPMQNFSMIFFESYNGKLQNYVTSARGASHQICRRYVRDCLLKAENPVITLERRVCLDELSYIPTLVKQQLLESFESLSFIKFYRKLKYFTTCSSWRTLSSSLCPITLRDNSFFVHQNTFIFHAKCFAEILSPNCRKILMIGLCYEVKRSTAFPFPHFYEIVSQQDDIKCAPKNFPESVICLKYQKQTIFAKFLNNAEASHE